MQFGAAKADANLSSLIRIDLPQNRDRVTHEIPREGEGERIALNRGD